MKKSGAQLFLAPALAHLLALVLVPIGFALYASLHDWKILKGTMPFVGFGKYQEILSDRHYWNAVMNSAKYAVLSVPIGAIVALGVALLVSQKLRFMGLFRTLFYIPAVSSTVAVSMMWIYIFLPQTGLINSATALFGIKSIDFLNDPSWAMFALAFMSIWTGLGPRMIVYVAGIQAIPPSVYEAAELDGASSSRKFFRITWPLLAHTNFFVWLTGLIAAFQVFTPVYMMTKGGPLDSTDVIGYHIYVEAWKKFHLSTASAQSFLLLLIIAFFGCVQWRLMANQLAQAAPG